MLPEPASDRITFDVYIRQMLFWWRAAQNSLSDTKLTDASLLFFFFWMLKREYPGLVCLQVKYLPSPGHSCDTPACKDMPSGTRTHYFPFLKQMHLHTSPTALVQSKPCSVCDRGAQDQSQAIANNTLRFVFYAKNHVSWRYFVHFLL